MSAGATPIATPGSSATSLGEFASTEVEIQRDQRASDPSQFDAQEIATAFEAGDVTAARVALAAVRALLVESWATLYLSH